MTIFTTLYPHTLLGLFSESPDAMIFSAKQANFNWCSTLAKQAECRWCLPVASFLNLRASYSPDTPPRNCSFVCYNNKRAQKYAHVYTSNARYDHQRRAQKFSALLPQRSRIRALSSTSKAQDDAWMTSFLINVAHLSLSLSALLVSIPFSTWLHIDGAFYPGFHYIGHRLQCVHYG